MKTKIKRIRALVSLLLTVLLLLPTLASCGGEEQTASSGETGTAVSQEPSAESEETSETVSEDTGEEPMENIRDNPDYKNILLGKSYTHSALYPDDSSASYPDEGNATLTDGQLPASDGKYSDPAFAGFNIGSDYSDRGYASIVVDLNGLYCMDKFEVYVGSKAFLDVGISAPAFAWVYASHDGETWHEVGITAHEDTEEVNCIPSVLELNSPVTARYLEFRIVADVSRWMFVAEVMGV